MDLRQAEALLKSEVASGSPVGKALVLVLEQAELEAYRQSRRAADPISMARVCGSGEGLHQVLNRLSPSRDAAPTGRPVSPGAV